MPTSLRCAASAGGSSGGCGDNDEGDVAEEVDAAKANSVDREEEAEAGGAREDESEVGGVTDGGLFLTCPASPSRPCPLFQH